MRSYTTKLILVFSAVLMAIIISMQIYWLNKTYSYEKHEFTTAVLKAIRGVYEDIPLLYSTTTPLDSLVEKYSESGFIFRIYSIPQEEPLMASISAELEDFKVFTDCQVALYDSKQNKYLFDNYIPAYSGKKKADSNAHLPLLKRSYNYVHLFFPNRNNYIIDQLQSWIFTSVLVLVLLVGFAFSIYFLYRQKFLVEVQKDFINNVTHEFSTPLSVIEIAVNGLQKPTTPTQPEQYKKYVDAIHYQSDYLKSHISNLIKTVIAGNYHFAIQKSEVIPNDLLKRAVAQLETILEKSTGSVVWNLETENLSINADGANLYLALFNIINNAIKYAKNPEIVITTQRKENNYLISIKDNGIGIDASQVKKIFNKFYRVQSGNLHNVKGLGLGLYFTDKVVKAHNGTIHVHSTLGTGTEFVIELPINK
ncbi:MAG: HAMP domain-containing histidine kinase [Bacteroidetes bacterium]|nr:HAMP domain-containing histidine kinase [Bacteroidota bacterium]